MRKTLVVHQLANMFISVLKTSFLPIYMSAFWIASYFSSCFNAASPVLFAHGDSMIERWFLSESSYCHFPNTENFTEHLAVERNCLCTCLGTSKEPFHSWLLLGLPNVSPFSCRGDFFAHLSSQVVLTTLHLLPLPPLFTEGLDL